MKKYIFILDALELMTKLIAGKRVEGVLYVDENTGRLTFKAYNRQPRVSEKDRMVKKLPWGWVKESMERIKVFGSVSHQENWVKKNQLWHNASWQLQVWCIR